MQKLQLVHAVFGFRVRIPFGKMPIMQNKIELAIPASVKINAALSLKPSDSDSMLIKIDKSK